MRRTSFRGLAAALTCGSLLWIAGCGDDKGATPANTTAGTRAEPVKASADALTKVAGVLKHPLYWAPGQAPETYELTQTSDGRVFIRYLPKGVEIGDPRPNFLTIGTYPQANAFATVEAGSKREGATVAKLSGGGLMVSQKAQPTSAFFSFPNSPVLVEVYSPTPGDAAKLITSGGITPIK